MILFNRFQVVAAVAAVICLYGIISAISVFASHGSYGHLDSADLSALGDTIAISLKKGDVFPVIEAGMKRDPFSEPSNWLPPQRAILPAPPMDGLLEFLPSSVLLRSDALPVLGPLPKADEKNADRQVMTQLKRIFSTTGRTGTR